MKMLRTTLLIVSLASVNAFNLAPYFTLLPTCLWCCLKADGPADGSSIGIYDCRNSPYVWTWPDEYSTEPTTIKSGSIDSCITVNGENVELWGCDPRRNQKWKFNLDYTISLDSDKSKCLDLTKSSTEPGTPVGIYKCKSHGDNQNQMWSRTGTV